MRYKVEIRGRASEALTCDELIAGIDELREKFGDEAVSSGAPVRARMSNLSQDVVAGLVIDLHAVAGEE